MIVRWFAFLLKAVVTIFSGISLTGEQWLAFRKSVPLIEEGIIKLKSKSRWEYRYIILIICDRIFETNSNVWWKMNLKIGMWMEYNEKSHFEFLYEMRHGIFLCKEGKVIKVTSTLRQQVKGKAMSLWSEAPPYIYMHIFIDIVLILS